MVKVVFMGTPDFSVLTLQALIATQQVVGVVTQPDRPAGRGRQLRPSPVKVVAQEAGIEIYQPRSLKTEEAAAPLRGWDPDIIVVAAFGQILRPHVLELPPHGCLNVHASLLPRWRGASPIQHAIMAGDAQTGISLMKMDPGLDTGPVFIREAVDITAADTAATLHDRLATLGASMIRRHLEAIIAGTLPPEPQQDDLATYAPMIKKEAGRLDWQHSAERLDRQIRAMTPWPSAYTTWHNQNLKIVAAVPHPSSTLNGDPGEVALHAEQVVVHTGAGILELKEVQLAGKKALPAMDFVRGRPDIIGSLLGV